MKRSSSWLLLSLLLLLLLAAAWSTSSATTTTVDRVFADVSRCQVPSICEAEEAPSFEWRLQLSRHISTTTYMTTNATATSALLVWAHKPNEDYRDVAVQLAEQVGLVVTLVHLPDDAVVKGAVWDVARDLLLVTHEMHVESASVASSPLYGRVNSSAVLFMGHNTAASGAVLASLRFHPQFASAAKTLADGYAHLQLSQEQLLQRVTLDSHAIPSTTTVASASHRGVPPEALVQLAPYPLPGSLDAPVVPNNVSMATTVVDTTLLGVVALSPSLDEASVSYWASHNLPTSTAYLSFAGAGDCNPSATTSALPLYRDTSILSCKTLVTLANANHCRFAAGTDIECIRSERSCGAPRSMFTTTPLSSDPAREWIPLATSWFDAIVHGNRTSFDAFRARIPVSSSTYVQNCSFAGQLFTATN